MPYFISNTADGCKGWATIKADGEVLGCHVSKGAAIDQMVALSLAEGIEPGGERNVNGDTGIILDIDDTLIHMGEPMQDVIDYVNNLEGKKFIITGRPVAQREETVKQLEDAGVSFFALYLKDTEESTPTFKKRIAENLLRRYNIVLAIDNDSANRAVYSDLGIKTLDPANLDEMNSDMSEVTYRAINQDAPEYMRANAKRGLAYYADGKGGDGLVDRTIREARLMAEGTVSDDKWVRIAAWIARHLGDLDSPNANPDSPNYPSAGVVAHLLWGSGSNKQDAQRTLDYAQSVVERIKKENENRMIGLGMLNYRDAGDWDLLNDRQQEQAESTAEIVLEYGQFDQSSLANGAHYAPAADNPFKADGLVCDNCIFYNENLQQCVVVEGSIEPEAVCKLWVIPESKIGMPAQAEEMPAEEMASRNLHYRSVGFVTGKTEGQTVGTNVERRVNHVEFDVRQLEQSGDKMTFTGYAAVFDSPSKPLPFTEYIRAGAFKRSLKSRNEIKLFMNHNTDVVLGSTRAGTLKLTEDSKGLLAEAELPPTTAGNDLSILMQRGDVNSMSFGFSVPSGGDKWSADGQTRELRQVRLHEVSIVTGFPAYEATTASVRSLDILATRTNVDVATLSDAITKLEAGETLEAEHADLISEVVSKLRAEDVAKSDLLELKRKQLDLMMKAI